MVAIYPLMPHVLTMHKVQAAQLLYVLARRRMVAPWYSQVQVTTLVLAVRYNLLLAPLPPVLAAL